MIIEVFGTLCMLQFYSRKPVNLLLACSFSAHLPKFNPAIPKLQELGEDLQDSQRKIVKLRSDQNTSKIMWTKKFIFKTLSKVQLVVPNLVNEQYCFCTTYQQEWVLLLLFSPFSRICRITCCSASSLTQVLDQDQEDLEKCVLLLKILRILGIVFLQYYRALVIYIFDGEISRQGNKQVGKLAEGKRQVGGKSSMAWLR